MTQIFNEPFFGVPRQSMETATAAARIFSTKLGRFGAEFFYFVEGMRSTLLLAYL